MPEGGSMETLIIVITVVLAIGIIYVASCFTTISAELVGIKSFLERLLPKIFTGTWLFVFWPFEKLWLFPRGQQYIDLPRQMIRTASATIGEVKYSRVTIETDVVMYFNLPIDSPDDLIEYIKEAPAPILPGENDESRAKKLDALLAYFGPSVIAAVRRSLGGLSWVECDRGITESDKTLSECVLEDLARNANNPVDRTRLRNVRFEFKNFTLPEELNKAIRAPQVAEYEANATKIRAGGEKERRKLEGEGDALARKAIYAVIHEIDEGIVMETLHTLREMAQGTSNTILYGLPPQVVDIIKKTGYEPSEEEMGKFASMLLAEMEKKKMI
jgi:regulator of protease activity HflC (stomatin/prohibitin superfamily)